MQRRVYDALNVLHALSIIKKDKNMIYFDPKNPIIPDVASSPSSMEQLEARDEVLEDPYEAQRERDSNKQRR